MKKFNEKLNLAKDKKNDEYYTLKADVEMIYKKILADYDLSKYVIDLPFDGYESEFYKVAKSYGWKVNIDCKFDYKNFNYTKDGGVL